MRIYYFVRLATVLFISVGSAAQTGPFNLSSVPETILKNASVIKHSEQIFFTIMDISKSSYSVHKIFTVMNEQGRDALLFTAESSKDIILEDAEIKVYDASGKQTARYKKKDMSTTAVGEGLIEDGYITYFPVSPPSYPVTVEVKYQLTFKGTLIFPDYRFIHPGEGVVESSYTARVPDEIGFRYKSKNINLQPTVKEEGKVKVYTWTVRNMAPIEYEEGAVHPSDRYPSVAFSPIHFSYYGYRGDIKSWQSFGTWINALYNGLDVLPKERVTFFNELVKNASSDREKARIIYDYLQKNFRYVSIQLGIGGLKPFSAEFTDQKKYGDCKALSNYMKSALNAVGIKSHIAIINAEYNASPVDPDFPSNDFNHVILCIPQKGDTIWLECTSNTTDFGVLGTFTENRNALLITENGGVLVPTPKSKAGDNLFSTRTVVKLYDDGSGNTETVFKTRGEYRETMDEILKSKKDDQKEMLVLGMGHKQPDVFEFVKQESADIHSIKLTTSIEKVPEFTAGSKWFLSPRLYKLWQGKLPRSENRKLDYFFRHPFEKYDSTVYILPAGFVSDVLPKPKEISCTFAKYKTSYVYDKEGNTVSAISSLILDQHRIPAAKYAEVKKFFDDVLMDDAQRIVIKKQ